MKRLVALLILGCATVAPPARSDDLLLTGGRIWTGATSAPWAEAVAISGDRIVGVGALADVGPLVASDATRIELGGHFVAPGFIDNHTHFDRAGALILGVNLLDVADAQALTRRAREASERMPAGAWLVGGDWGAYEAWGQGSAGASSAEFSQFVPHRALVDPPTVDNPVLLSKWDGTLHLANSPALAAAGLSCTDEGVDCDDAGRTTGRLTGAAVERVRDVIPDKSLEQRLAEARVALERLRGFGVTTIHDITRPEQMAVFQELDRLGELTVRVYARPTLDRWEHLAALGIRHGYGNERLKIGGLKGFVDGIMGNSSARFYEPYLTSGERGRWRRMMEPWGNMEKLLLGADAAGHWPQVHAIGDEAIDHLLDLYAKVIEQNGERERRLRVIHTQVLRGAEVAKRMAEMGVIAEVQPYHAIDDMRWMEQRIGDRSRWAYAFKTLEDAGVTLSFGSDWPGTNASWYPANPMLGIYAAVTRQTLGGEPAEGWFPQERVSLETALRAYTVNNAWAAGEEAIKGTLEAGKLADLVVLDRSPFEVEPSELQHVRAVLTLVGGEIVHRDPSWR